MNTLKAKFNPSVLSLLCSGLLCVIAVPVVAQVPKANLLAYFPMDGNANDTSSAVGGSSSANNGVWSGSSGFQAGMFGQAAIVGNGSGSNYLTTTSAEYAFGANSFTILYWVNMKAAISSDPVLIAGGGKNWSSSGGTQGWVSTISSGDDVKANVSDGSSRSDTARVDLDHDAQWNDNRNHWALIALVVDRTSNTLTSYVLDDNVINIGDDSSSPATTGISGGDLTGSNQNIVIGQDGDFAGYGPSPYPGLPATGIDDLSIWSRVLTQAEIQTIYTEGRNGNPLSSIIGGTYLTASLDKEAGNATLEWDVYDVTGLTNPEVRIFRNGTLLTTVSETVTSYVDAPPAPVNVALNYTYRVELFDGASAVADSAVEAEVVWAPGGLAYGLVGNWRFEDGFKDTASGAVAHDGTALNGASISGGGVSGHRVELLDQLKQGVQVADHNDLDFGSSDDFTVSVWVQRNGAMTTAPPNGEAGDGVIICKQDWSNGSSPGWGIYATSDGGVKWNLAGSSRKSGEIANGASGIADTRWYHILVANDRSGSARCYVNGVLKKTIDISGAGSVDNALPLTLGVDGNGGYSWKGSLDEVAIWSRVLNDTEVLDVYRAGIKGIGMSGVSIIDTDGDDLNDTWEITHFGNLDQTAEGDYDSDGRTNIREYAQGSDPDDAGLTVESRVTTEEVEGQDYPILHYIRPAINGNMSYIPEASGDLNTWVNGDDKFIPYGNPTDLGNGMREFHVRYYQSLSAVTAGRVLLRVRMNPRYQGEIGDAIEPTVELRNGQAIVTWTTATPTVTILSYGKNGQTTTRYEDYNLSTYHEVVISNIQPDEAFTYTVIQEQDGVVYQSRTFTTHGTWDYSPPPIPDQAGYQTPGDWATHASAILSQNGVLDRGYCLDYLCGDGKLAYELARQSQIVVIGVEDTQAEVDAARAFLVARGVYGSRVTVVLASDLANLPVPDDFFNVIVSQSQIDTSSDFNTFKSAVQGHLIPARGFVVGKNGGAWQADDKPAHADTGEWTMSYGNPANTGASKEAFSGKTSMNDFELRWLGAPGPELAWDRQTAEQPPLAANGRFYCQGKGRLLALDSHNGSVLWTKELDDAQRFNMLRDAGNLTADDEGVWLALRKQAWKMDGDTGAITTFNLVEGSRSDLDYSWNYICRTGSHLLGSASIDSAYYKKHWGSQYWYTHVGGSLTSQVCSDNLFSLHASTGATNWIYEDGLILSVTITVGNGKVYFLETRNPTAVAGNSRRLSMGSWKNNLYLVCLNLSTGAKEWDSALSFSGGDYTTFLLYDEINDKLVLKAGNGSSNYLYGFNPSNGNQIWNTSASCYKTDHGGKSQHPVISEGELLLTPNVFNPNTGAILRSNIPTNGGGGCNTYWGSKNLLFYRTGYSGKGLSMWPKAGGSATGVDHVKGACWLNWAPADGMFLIQEKSAGCSCGAWVHISQGWGPKQ